MCKGEFAQAEPGGSRRFTTWKNPLAEKSELKTILMTLLIGEVSGCIPPLCFEVTVRTMITGKNVFPSWKCLFPLR
jgi:hypothetical protein